MQGDTTPQDRAVEILLDSAMGFQAIRDAEDPDAPVNDKYFEDQAAFQVKALADAGLLSAPQEEEGSLRSEPSAAAEAELVAEALRDFKFEVGPNTLEMLKVGQAVYLTPEERHQIAHAAVNAVRQVMADE